MDLGVGRQVRRLFHERFGAPAATPSGGPAAGAGERLFFACGRVNLLGAHVDYHGGPVLPLAIDRGVFVAARLRPDRRVRLVSLDFPGTHEWDLDAPPLPAQAGWSVYPLSILVTLESAPPPAGAGPGRQPAAPKRLSGMDLAFGGTVPPAAGMSSSAAILVATATAAAALQGFELPPLECGRLAHRAETQFVGVKCGIMDQFASAFGRAGHALWLDCKDQSHEYVPLPSAQMAFVVLDSMTRRELKDGGYNQRVAESTGALTRLKKHLPGATCLRDVSVSDLDRLRPQLPDLEWKRARHVVTEIARVRRAKELLARGELLEFGQLMWLSHLSSRHLYEVSTARLDALQESALGHPDCYGARLTGAGFGGCALAVVRPGAEESFCAHVIAGFEQRFGERPDVYPLKFGQAPCEVTEA